MNSLSLASSLASSASNPRQSLVHPRAASTLPLRRNTQVTQVTPRPIRASQVEEGQTVEKQQPQASSPIQRFVAAAALCGALAFAPVDAASARLEGVNKPELLPDGFTRVIDTGGFLSSGQVKRLSDDLGRLEEDTGFKLRVLSQSYPNTPGLAIRDYWGVDDSTIVFVADPTFKNILNFNVGATVDLRVPRSFWSRLAGKYGNMFYWKENGEDAAIENAVIAIDSCLREEPGPRQCSDIK